MKTATNALELLRADHRNVLSLLQRFERTDDENEQRELCGRIVDELDVHTKLEEQVFYPYVRDSTDELELIEEATIEHDAAKELMDELQNDDAEPPRFHALMKVLGEYIRLHVREEEQQIFPLVQRLGVDLDALGEELIDRKEALANGGERRADHHDERQRDDRHRERRGGSDNMPEARLAGHIAEHAKWIDSIDEHEDHPGQMLATRNVDVVRQWADERDARPATTPGGDKESPRVLRFDLPDYDALLEPVEWDDWLKVFEERNLVFIYQEHLKSGRTSNFFRLDNPARDDG